MAKKKPRVIELDPKMLNAKTVPYPCAGCKKSCGTAYYKFCKDWRGWFSTKFKEVKETLTEVKR